MHKDINKSKLQEIYSKTLNIIVKAKRKIIFVYLVIFALGSMFGAGSVQSSDLKPLRVSQSEFGLTKVSAARVVVRNYNANNFARVSVNSRKSEVEKGCDLFVTGDHVSLQGASSLNLNQPAGCFQLEVSSAPVYSSALTVETMQMSTRVVVVPGVRFENQTNLETHEPPDSTTVTTKIASGSEIRIREYGAKAEERFIARGGFVVLGSPDLSILQMYRC